MSSFGRVLTLQQILDSFSDDKPVGVQQIRDLIATIAQGGISPLLSSADGITAKSGGGQGSATALTAGINRITGVAAANDSVLLPKSSPGECRHVTNAHATNSMNVFPMSGDQINALGANAAFALAAGKTAVFTCAKAGQWHAVLSA